MGVRVGVIGVGSMGIHHARVYNEMPEADLVGVADSNPSAACTAGQNLRVPCYSDYREMLVKEKPDAVSIAVPTALHHAVAMDVMNYGVSVLVEKPIAATLEEAVEMNEQAARLGVCLTVGHIVRFNPAIQALKARLDAGELGRIFQIFCRRAGPFPERVLDVGVVVDLAPHDLDIMRFLTGLEPLRIYAEMEQRIHTDHEDLLFGVLRFPEGITAALEINWLTPTKVREVLVLGERGLFRVDDLTQDLYFYENAQAGSAVQWSNLRTLKGVSEGSMVRYPLHRYEPLKAELQAFVKAVRGEAPVAVSGEDGLKALRLALALVKSGQEHIVVQLA
jgi:predicted dehydrogenase